MVLKKRMFVKARYGTEPAQECDVEVEVDGDRIMRQLAPKALKSKRRLSQCMCGAVKLRVRPVQV